MSRPRVGLYGGTFDPPHRAHLALAEAARDALGLTRVELTPAATPPHRDAPRSPGVDRYAMVVLAALERARLAPSPRELLREGISFTVETLRQLREEEPDAELFLLLGGDSYDDFDSWKEAGAIRELAHLVIAPRPGSRGVEDPLPADRGRVAPARPGTAFETTRVFGLKTQALAISASDLRERLAAGERALPELDPRVEAYALARGLYARRHKESSR